MRISDWSSDVCSSDLKGFVLRFHLGPHISASLTADGLGGLLRIAGGPLWQFRTSEGSLAVEESLWVDGEGRPHPTEQLVVTSTAPAGGASIRSEEHTSELQSLMRISYAVFCLKKKKT